MWRSAFFACPFWVCFRVGENVWIRLEFIYFADSRLARLPRSSFSFYMSSLLWQIRNSDRSRSVLFPAKYKTESQFSVRKECPNAAANNVVCSLLRGSVQSLKKKKHQKQFIEKKREIIISHRLWQIKLYSIFNLKWL